MKKISLIFFLCLSAFNLCSQTTFEKTYPREGPDYGYAFVQTLDGGYALIGKSSGFSINSDTYLIKTNQHGDTVWTKNLGVDATDEGWDILEQSSGDLVILSQQGGTRSIKLTKTDATGNIQWSKDHFENTFNNYNAIEESPDNGFVLLGRKNSLGDWITYVLAVDQNGDSLWAKTYDLLDKVHYSIKRTTDGYILSGTTVEYGLNDMLFTKIDFQGNYVWSNTFGGDGYETAYSVDNTSDGGFIFAGITTETSSADNDVLLVKTTNQGSVEWSHTYGGIEDDIGYSVKQTQDKGFLVVGESDSFGSFAGKMYLIKIDSSGNQLWSKVFGNAATKGNCIQLTSDGGFAALGSTLTDNSFDYYLVKLNANGEFDTVSNTTQQLLFPNPTTAETSITFEQQEGVEYTLCLYNFQGDLVRELNDIASNVPFRLDGILSGIYYYKLSGGNTKAIEGKLVIQ
jgi:Secretion system C-terminal sorting domain